MNKIVFGTWSLSGDYGNVELSTIKNTLMYAYKNGIIEYDTAPSYGNGFAEFCLGNVFKDKDVLINTKVGNFPFRGKDFSLSYVVESFNQSLARLQRTSVNVLFLHNPREIPNYAQLVEWMQKLKAEGKIKYMGICLARDYNYSMGLLSNFDVIQDDTNILDRNFESRSYGQAVLYGRSPLASGMLSGKFKKNTIFAPEDHRSAWLKGERLNQVLDQISKIPIEKNLIYTARKFVLTHPKINKIIFGVKNKKQMKELILDAKSYGDI